MVTRAIITLGLVVLLFPKARAAEPVTGLDPEATTPYRWQVLLHTRPHPLLSAAYRADVRREIIAAIPPMLGPLGTIEVVDLADLPQEQWPAIAKEFNSRGWAALDASHLRELDGVKTQILHLELRGSDHVIETRQLDGFTGLALPLSRRTTRSPELVGRLAGLMLDHDFGLDGTVETAGRPAGEAIIRIRGGALGPIDRFLPPGSVFAVAGVRKSIRPPGPPPMRTATGRVVEKVKEAPPAFTAVPREFTLLRTVEAAKDGSVRCKVFAGYPNALPAAGVLGYRGLKLPTVSTPLSIRLVGRTGGTPRATTSATVRANDIGWEVKPGSDELDQRDGVFRSSRPLGHLAFLTLNAGPTRSSRVPIPVLGSDPVDIPFNLDPADEKRIAFERDCNDLARHVADARTSQNGYFAVLKTLMEAQKNREALARAQAAVALTDADEKELAAAHARLRESVVLSPAMTATLDGCERRITDLRGSKAELIARTADLDRLVARENDPLAAAMEIQAESLNTRIKLLLQRGDVDEALTVYDQLVTLLPNNPEVASRRDKLRGEWTTKSEAHTKAREYLTQSWPALITIPDLKESLKTLESSVDECIRQKDRYTCRKLLTTVAVLPVKVHDLTQSLDGTKDADRVVLSDAEKVIETVGTIEAKVREFLKDGSGPPP